MTAPLQTAFRAPAMPRRLGFVVACLCLAAPLAIGLGGWRLIARASDAVGPWQLWFSRAEPEGDYYLVTATYADGRQETRRCDGPGCDVSELADAAEFQVQGCRDHEGAQDCGARGEISSDRVRECYDFDSDGVIGIQDFGLLAVHWGKLGFGLHEFGRLAMDWGRRTVETGWGFRVCEEGR